MMIAGITTILDGMTTTTIIADSLFGGGVFFAGFCSGEMTPPP